ncbi:hypothetical protein HY030_00065 [Candidatus Gottesmanbacteria bacterium]|nr:hypothetical protein [Candidatus Gottesmanbacteria bacterium]
MTAGTIEVLEANHIIESSLYHLDIEKIDFNSPKGLTDVNLLAGKVFETIDRPGVEGIRVLMGNTPEGRSRVLRAVHLHDFPPQDSVGWDIYETLLKASQFKEKLSRDLIIGFVKNGANFGLKEYELDVITTLCRIGGVYDDLCLRWREDVQRNPLNLKAKELGIINQYSVLINDEGQPKQVPYSVRYKEEIDQITSAWQELAARLSRSEDQDALGIGKYFSKYAEALGGKNLDTLAESWRNVDRIWMQEVRGRLQLIGTREYGYYDPNKYRIFPDMRLSIKEEATNAGIIKVKNAMKKFLTLSFGSFKVFQETFSAMEKVMVIFGDDVVFTGSLDFQPSGESLPNERVVQKEEGTKVFVTPNVLEARWNLALDLARKVFPQDYHLFQSVNVLRDACEIMTGGHEFGEPLFQTDEVEAALGEEITYFLNEDLANLSITAVVPHAVESKEMPPEILMTHAVRLLGVCLRHLDVARGQEHLQPYNVGPGLLGLRRMIETGFIYKEGSIAL